MNDLLFATQPNWRPPRFTLRRRFTGALGHKLNPTVENMPIFILRAALIVIAAFPCFPALSQTGIGSTQPGDGYYQRAEANYAAYRYLRAMDSGDYASLWKHTAPIAKNGLTESKWITTVANIRKVFGSYQERTEARHGFSSKMTSGEVGNFYVLVFRTRFSSLTVEERIVLSHEDGEWKLAGYFLNT